MPLHVLPQSEGWGETLGRGLGQGISSAIQGLAEGKLAKMQQAQQYEQNVRGLKALGINNAEEAAHLPSNLLDMFVKQKLQEPGEKAYANALSSILGGGQQGQTPATREPQEPELVRKEVTPSQKAQLKKYIESPQGKAKYKPEQIKKINEFLARPSVSINQKNPKYVAPQQDQQQQGINLGGLNAKQATEIAKLGLEQQKIARKDRSEARAESKVYRDELRHKAKAAKETLESLERFEELEKEGLPGAGYVEFLKNANLDVPALIGAPAEEYNKIAANFIRNAKAVFGARLTDTDLEQFLKTVPSLSNSPEGRKRINANLKRIAQLEVIESEAAKDIIKENGGEVPFDFAEKVDERVDKKRESVYKQFKADLKKKVPEGESALATSLLSGAGKLIGSATSGGLKGAARGAVAGAAWGRYAGGPGALAGGGLGALAGLTGII